MSFFGTLKKARKLELDPLNLSKSLHLTREDFNPAEFHRSSTGHKRIISYNPTSLFIYGFINPKGSTLSWGVILRTLLMCGVGTLVSQYTCAKGQEYSFCFPVIVSAEGLIFASLVSFLLGLFTSTTFTRWWSIREKLGIVMNNTTLLSMFLRTFAPKDEETAVIIVKAERWMHLAHTLIYKGANNDNDYSDLVLANIATENEVQALTQFQDVSKPPIVYSWILTLLQPVITKIVPAGAITPALACITNCLNASQEISAFLKTQMPYMYLHLLALTTKIHLVLIIFYAGGMISQGLSDHLWTRIMLGYTVIITNNVIYEGLLRVHEMLYNPLGDDNADFPTDLYVSSTVSLGNAVSIPPPSEEEVERKDKGISVQIS